MTEPVLHLYDLGPGVTAFSSTRHGGVGKGNYASFNINYYCGDREEDIMANRKALCQLLGVSASDAWRCRGGNRQAMDGETFARGRTERMP